MFWTCTSCGIAYDDDNYPECPNCAHTHTSKDETALCPECQGGTCGWHGTFLADMETAKAEGYDGTDVYYRYKKKVR